MEKRRIKQFTTPKINAIKIIKHIQIFNYLINFSDVKIEELSPSKRLDMIHEYINIIGPEFYQYDYETLLTLKTECSIAWCSERGERKVLGSLEAIQNNLLFSIANFVWFIRTRINKKDLTTGLIGFEVKTGISYNYDTNDFEPKCILRYDDDIFKAENITDIFVFIILQLLTVYSIDRFILCDQCGKLFFNRSLKEKRFCNKKCSGIVRAARFKSKNKD